MSLTVENVPMETRWSMATGGLTGTLVAHLNTLYEELGKKKYSEIVRRIWGPIGQGSAAQAVAMGLRADDAKSVGEAGAIMCICAMGPEYQIETVESSIDRIVLRVTQCPWNNRLNEMEIPNDVMSVCDTAFWQHFVQYLNPGVSMRHGKKMHLGDPYCEYIFEKR